MDAILNSLHIVDTSVDFRRMLRAAGARLRRILERAGAPYAEGGPAPM